MPSTSLRRRSVLTAGLGASLAAALAACSARTEPFASAPSQPQQAARADLTASIKDQARQVPFQSITYDAPNDNITLTHAAGFTMAAVIWDADSPVQPNSVTMRLREKGSGWSAWKRMEAMPADPGSSTNNTAGTDALTTGGADAIQIRVDSKVRGKGGNSAKVKNLRVVLSHSELTEPPAMGTLTSAKIARTDAGAETETVATLTSAVAAPMIYTRAMWGCVESDTRDFTRTMTVKGLTIHHTGSSNNYEGIAAECQQIRNITYYHTVTLGWGDVAYSFLIGKSGTIFQGRRRSMEMPEVGYHCLGLNYQAVGVSCLGDYENAVPSTAMITSLVSTLTWLSDRYDLDPLGKVTLTSEYTGGSARYPKGTSFTSDVLFPHQAHNSTDCPGKNIMSELPAIRQRVADSLSAARAPKVSTVLPSFSSTTAVTPLYAAASTSSTVLVQAPRGVIVLRSGQSSGSFTQVAVNGRRGWIQTSSLSAPATVTRWGLLSASTALRGAPSNSGYTAYTGRAWGSLLVLSTSGGFTLVAMGGHIGWVPTANVTDSTALGYHLATNAAVSAQREPWGSSSWTTLPAGASVLTTRRESGGMIEIVLNDYAGTAWIPRTAVSTVIAR